MRQPLFADRGFSLGPVFRRAADRHGAVFVTLDRPLDVAPGLGVDLTYTVLAELVEEWSGRLWEAGVRPSEQVVVHKADNVDIMLLTCAVARSGPCRCCCRRRWPRPWPGSSSNGCAGPG